MSRFLPLAWDHLGCQLGPTGVSCAVVGRGLPLLIIPVRVICRSEVAYWEVHVIEVWEVLRPGLGGERLRSVAGHRVVSPGVCPGA